MTMEELGVEAAEELGLLLSRALSYDECSVELVRSALLGHPDARPRYTLGWREGGRLVAAVLGFVQERWENGMLVRGEINWLAPCTSTLPRQTRASAASSGRCASRSRTHKRTPGNAGFA